MGFTADYVESIPPAEREIYFVYFKEEQKQASKQDNNAPSHNIGGAIDTMGN